MMSLGRRGDQPGGRRILLVSFVKDKGMTNRKRLMAGVLVLALLGAVGCVAKERYEEDLRVERANVSRAQSREQMASSSAERARAEVQQMKQILMKSLRELHKTKAELLAEKTKVAELQKQIKALKAAVGKRPAK